MSAVNDDFCDCETGVMDLCLPNTRFYCENAGHVGSFIPSSRVGDGLVVQIGEAHRAKQEAEDKLRRTGAKIRASYIAHAHQEKTRLEKRLEELTKEIEAKALEWRSLEMWRRGLRAFRKPALEFKRSLKHLEREKALGQILDSLRPVTTPITRDMAGPRAVRGWEELAGLPHINDVKKVDSATTDDITGGFNTDYTNLLLEHEEHIGQPAEDTLLWDSFLTLLEKLSIIRSDSPNVAQNALTQAQSALTQLQTQKEQALRSFGKRGEWKKLDNAMHYIYELCLFKEAKQKPQSGSEYYSKQYYKRGTRSVVKRGYLCTRLEKCEYQFTATTPALCLPLEGSKGSAGKDEL
ncbi:endoplasmic reticulum protein [Coprinopsis sp. MPI-PUGE-AT-0042]|nr:endoplasmic reticulum protein [Coprinopsis sp. MPI-PUGE-AT-0042]